MFEEWIVKGLGLGVGLVGGITLGIAGSMVLITFIVQIGSMLMYKGKRIKRSYSDEDLL